MTLSFQKNKSTVNIVNLQKITLNEKLVKDISEKMGWAGNGTQEDPIVITGNNIPLKLCISKSKYYLVLKNLNLTNLILYHCQNILVQECRIHSLILNKCQQITVKCNSIMKIQTPFSRANIFEENDIYRTVNYNYENRLFDVFSFFSLIFGILLLFFTIRELFIQNFQWISVFLIIAGVLIIGSVSYFLILNFQTRKLSPNEFHNNTSISRLRQIFFQNYSTQINS